jgi:hypothetical protein
MVRSYYLGMHTVSGRQGGVGSPPLNPFAAPSAVPNTNNKNPIMIFAFMCLSSAAVAAMGTDSKRRSALQSPQNAHPVCHNLRATISVCSFSRSSSVKLACRALAQRAMSSASSFSSSLQGMIDYPTRRARCGWSHRNSSRRRRLSGPVAKRPEKMVRKGGLEPPRFYPPDPKSGASANSATLARCYQEFTPREFLCTVCALVDFGRDRGRLPGCTQSQYLVPLGISPAGSNACKTAQL